MTTKTKIYCVTAGVAGRNPFRLRAFLDIADAEKFLADCVAWDASRQATRSEVNAFKKNSVQYKAMLTAWHLSCPMGVFALRCAFTAALSAIVIYELDDEMEATLEIGIIQAEAQSRDVSSLQDGVW